MVHIACHLFVRKIFYFSEFTCIHDGTAAKLQGFKPLISVHHIGPAQHNTVIFHNYGPETFVLKHTGNFFSKVFTPRCAIRRKTDIATDIMRLRNNLGIGDSAGDAESDQRRWMSMNDCRYIRTRFVNRPVERIF